MKARRIICVFLIVSMIFAISACAGGDSGAGSQPPSTGGNSNTPASPSTGGNSNTPASPSGGGTTSPSTPSGGGGGNASTPPSTETPAAPSNSGGGETGSPPSTETPAPPSSSGGGGTGTPPATTSPSPPAGGGSSSGLSGDPHQLLEKLVDAVTEEIKAAGEFMYMSFITDVTPDLSQNAAGLSEADFGSLVIAAASSMAAIGSQAHQIVLFQAKNSNAAAEVKKIVAGRASGKDGYDSQKWICVWPEQSIVVESGDYVLLVASRVDIVESALGVFTEMAGKVGSVDKFYEHLG